MPGFTGEHCECEGECDIACEGSWSACTASCEAAKDRTWSETVAQSGGGSACPEPSDCEPGQGDCLAEEPTDGSATGDAVDGSWQSSAESPAAAALGLASFDAAETAAVATIGALALVAMGAVIRRSHHRRFQQHVRIPDDPSMTQSADGATDVDEHAERVLLTAAV